MGVTEPQDPQPYNPSGYSNLRKAFRRFIAVNRTSIIEDITTECTAVLLIYCAIIDCLHLVCTSTHSKHKNKHQYKGLCSLVCSTICLNAHSFLNLKIMFKPDRQHSICNKYKIRVIMWITCRKLHLLGFLLEEYVIMARLNSLCLVQF